MCLCGYIKLSLFPEKLHHKRHIDHNRSERQRRALGKVGNSKLEFGVGVRSKGNSSS